MASAFTLLELLLVFAVMGTLAAVAVPRYANFLAKQRVEAAARRIQADLAFAGKRAKTTGTAVTMLFAPVAHSYSLQVVPDMDHPGEVYSVDLAREPYRTEIWSVDFGGDNAVVFSGYGKADSSGSVVIHSGEYAAEVEVDGTVTVDRKGDNGLVQLGTQSWVVN